MIHLKIRIKKSFLLDDKIVPLLQVELLTTGREEEGRDKFIEQLRGSYDKEA